MGGLDFFYFCRQSFRTEHMNHLENNVKFEDSDSVSLGWGLRLSISKELPAGTDANGLGIMLGKPLL